MYFAQLIKIKSIIVSVCISIILSSFTTFLYTKQTTGKKIVTVILKEDYNSEIYFLISKDFFLSELFEKVRLKYFINNLKETDALKKIIFYKNIKNLNQECKKSMSINYIEVDKRTFAMEVADKIKNTEAINLCISSTIDLINNSINDQINEITAEFKFNWQKSPFAPFAVMPPEIIGNENFKLLYKDFLNLENKIKKNPIKVEDRFETSISKFTSYKIFFITIFICYFFIAVFILERKKIFKYFKK
jgi:hypothetical protein